LFEKLPTSQSVLPQLKPQPELPQLADVSKSMQAPAQQP
jgi:hypothetical protein